MDHEVNTRNNALKRRLEDGSAEPMDLPLSLLEDITNCFSDDRQIGRGGFAIVYKGIVGHRMVAVKKLSNTFDLEETKFHKEVECLVKARHKNIVRFLGYCAETQGQIADFEGKFVMADTRNWLLCFEYVTNGSLDKYITDASHGLEWGKRFEIIKGICEGLCYLHDKRILHLDLKPANILIADHMVPKIADFGLSRCLDEAQTRLFTSRLCGSVGYLAPEFFRGQVAFASDIYSLGVVIVEILTGEKGYPEDKSVVESWMDRLKGETQLEQVRVCTKIGIECMELDPNKRPAVRHIIDRLQKTSSIVKSGIHSSLGEQEVFLLKKQHNDEKIGNTFAAEIEGVAKCQEKEDQLSLWELQDTEQDQTIIPSDDSSVSQKLSNLDIDKSGSRRKNRKSNYMRYGGPTVRKSNSVKIFREKELKPILDIGKLIGRGSFGDVYEGILGNRLVAVRKPIAGSLLLGEDFANEVIKRSQVIHNNILRLIGCCLEGDIPMLVYELLSNGSLLDIVEIMSEVHVDLGVRLRIAAQAADGLAYMHSESNNRTLFGCGLAAENILLDDNFVAKISDFGRLMRREATGLDSFIGRPTRNPSDYFIGRPGPCNEVYSSDQPAASNKETQQIDIYSFGVIILQLISTKKATSVNVDNLVTYFLKCQKNGKKATEMFDKEIAITRDLAILDSLAEIAVECIRTEGLSTDVDARPKMTEGISPSTTFVGPFSASGMDSGSKRGESRHLHLMAQSMFSPSFMDLPLIPLPFKNFINP